MKWRKAVIVAVLLAVPMLAWTGPQAIVEYQILKGDVRTAGSQDTTEYASAWFDVFGASRVVIKTWSAGVSTDTCYVDSITTFKVLLTDSIVTMVNADGLNTFTGADSVMIDATVAVNYDSTGKGYVIVSIPLPINKALKASANASGLMTVISPLGPGTVAIDATTRGVISKKWMRIRVLPRVRLTTAGFSSTAGIRTSGVRGLRMTAVVYYPQTKYD
jgi:hypothetical protein